MKKALVTLFAVAILGAIGLRLNNHGSGASLVPQPASSTLGASSSGQTASSTTSPTATSYKDGTYTGDAAQTPYGIVQIAAVISSGKITDIRFLQMPSDQAHSQEVTSFSEPLLKQTAIDKQNATTIDFVSGATSTSYGFQESLQAALDQAKLS